MGLITVEKIIIPVNNLEQAKQFWTEKFNLQLVNEQSTEDWLEFSLQEQTLTIVLRQRRPDETKSEIPEYLPHSNIFFACDDIKETYTQLQGRGVKFSFEPQRQDFGWWALFEDQEGTRFALIQKH